MRILITFTIAFLFTLLDAGMSSGQTVDHSCPDGIPMGRTIDKADCCCSDASRFSVANSSNDTLVGDDCCPPATCRGLFYTKEVAFVPTVSSGGDAGLTQSPYQDKVVPLVIIGVHRLGVPPPRLFSVPIYIQHCSFLI